MDHHPHRKFQLYYGQGSFFLLFILAVFHAIIFISLVHLVFEKEALAIRLFFFVNALFKELVDSPQKRTEKTEEVSMILL